MTSLLPGYLCKEPGSRPSGALIARTAVHGFGDKAGDTVWPITEAILRSHPVLHSELIVRESSLKLSSVTPRYLIKAQREREGSSERLRYGFPNTSWQGLNQERVSFPGLGEPQSESSLGNRHLQGSYLLHIVVGWKTWLMAQPVYGRVSGNLTSLTFHVLSSQN